MLIANSGNQISCLPPFSRGVPVRRRGVHPAVAHSLRSGFITSAARAGVAERDIQNQSGHRSLPVLRGYIRRGSLFIDNAAAKVGL